MRFKFASYDCKIDGIFANSFKLEVTSIGKVIPKLVFSFSFIFLSEGDSSLKARVTSFAENEIALSCVM